MTPKHVALAYVRVSRLDEEERARKISPDMQRDKALALRELDGLDVEHFADLDISGKATENRPGYLAMMDRLGRGDVRYVVAYDQSRITRNVGDLQRFREAIARNGALFIEASTGRVLDPEDEDQELGSNVIGSVDQHYRRKLARRVRDALAAKVSRGELVGPVPAGYVRRREVLENGKIARTWVEPDPERAPTVQLLFREYATGRYSLKSIAREMNARGVPQPRPRHFRNNRTAAEIWTADVAKDLLTNPRYVGRIPTKDGRVIPGTYAALIDDDTWAACERVRLRQRPMGWNMGRLGKHRWATSPYLLSAVLRCRHCGSTMSGETWQPDRAHREPRRRYTCYRRRTARACTAAYVPQELLEQQLIEILRSVCLPDGFVEAVDAAVAAYLREGQPRRRVSARALDDQLKRLKTLYELGDLTLDDYVARRDEIRAEKERAASSPAKPDLLRQRDTLQTLVDDWQELTIEERKRLVSLVFEQIEADAERGITRFLPRADWKRYMRAVVGASGASGGVTERKTGLEPATLALATPRSTN